MSAQNLTLEFATRAGAQTRQATVRQLVVAGWTGRDRVAMEKHIAELEALGVRRPASTPVFYRVAASRLTLAPAIQVSGGESSGEVEFVLAQFDGRLWIGLGSDHTDRKVETIGVTISKQLCEKPIGATFWPFDEVASHWDQLVLRSYVVEGGKRSLYQEGPVTTMQDPLELIAAGNGGKPELAEGTAMFCGTLAAQGGIRPAARFEMELHDPVLQRKLAHGYDIETLPVAG